LIIANKAKRHHDERVHKPKVIRQIDFEMCHAAQHQKHHDAKQDWVTELIKQIPKHYEESS
jgi:hypothetical protein